MADEPNDRKTPNIRTDGPLKLHGMQWKLEPAVAGMWKRTLIRQFERTGAWLFSGLTHMVGTEPFCPRCLSNDVTIHADATGECRNHHADPSQSCGITFYIEPPDEPRSDPDADGWTDTYSDYD